MAADSESTNDSPRDSTTSETETISPKVSTEGGVSEPVRSAPIDRIIKMRVPVIVKIAQKKMKVSEVLRLNIGSVIPFDKDAYQHIDLLVNNCTIGLGQPVKIGENFGLKIAEIADITETIKSLGPVL